MLSSRRREEIKAGDSTIVLDAVLGRGAFSSVYKGSWGLRLVAVKLFKGTEGRDNSDVFAREVQVAAACHHDNLISLLVAGETEDPQNESQTINFMVFPYAGERTLRDVIQSTTAGARDLPMHDKENIMTQLLYGVRALHTLQICHHDLKPENIMVSSGGRCKISDFGLSSFHGDAITRKGKGTPIYSGPEAAEGNMGFGSDIWSLGIIFYELLQHGEHPFHGRTFDELFRDIRNNRPMPWKATVPKVWQQVVAKMLVVNPLKRATVDEILMFLTDWNVTLPEETEVSTGALLGPAFEVERTGSCTIIHCYQPGESRGPKPHVLKGARTSMLVQDPQVPPLPPRQKSSSEDQSSRHSSKHKKSRMTTDAKESEGHHHGRHQEDQSSYRPHLTVEHHQHHQHHHHHHHSHQKHHHQHSKHHRSQHSPSDGSPPLESHPHDEGAPFALSASAAAASRAATAPSNRPAIIGPSGCMVAHQPPAFRSHGGSAKYLAPESRRMRGTSPLLGAIRDFVPSKAHPSFGQGPSEEHDAPLSEDASKKRERKKGSYRGPSPVEEGSRKSTFTNHFQEENSTARVDGKSRKKRHIIEAEDDSGVATSKDRSISGKKKPLYSTKKPSQEQSPHSVKVLRLRELISSIDSEPTSH